MAERVAGICFLKVDGEQIPVMGSFSYGLGRPTREGVVGPDAVHGYKEMVSIPFIEGSVPNKAAIDLDILSKITSSTITLELASGKVVVLREAWNTNPDGLTGDTEEGSVNVRFEGLSAEEVR